MAEGLVEELQLDIGPALDALEPLGAALTALATDFASSISDALSSLGDVTAAPVDVSVTADTSELDAGIADAFDAPRPPIDVEGDTGPLADAIDEATSVTPTISVDADTTAATQAIDALDDTPITLSAEADTSAAQDQIDGLTSSVNNLGGSGSKSGEGLAGLEGAVLGVKAATGAATGEVGGLSEGLSSLSGGTAAAIGGFTALGAFIGETTKLAADAQAQNKRFADTFGDLAEQVEKINVGGLNTDLETLGKTSGTTAADLEATASRIGLLGQSSGASNETIVSTTQNLLALGATISVNNPRLGDAAAVTDRLTNAFARGGRALAPFGIALSSAQINTEALRETGKSTANDLTLFEKSTAGATLALATFGDTLGDKFQEGAQNAQVQLRALKVQLEETLVAIGGPLLQPLVQSLQELLPVAQETGVIFGNLAQIILPFIADLAPALGTLASGLGFVADGVASLQTDVDAIESPLGAAAIGFGALAAAMAAGVTPATVLAGALTVLEGPVGLVVAGLAILGAEGAFSHFSSTAKEAAINTSVLSEAFTQTATSGGAFAGTLTNVNKELDEFLKKQLTVGKVGQQPVDALNALGLSAEDLQKTLTGSQDTFDKFELSLDTTGKANDDNIDSFIKLQDVVHQARAALEAGAQTTLQTAINTGLLTQANSGNAAAFLEARDSVGDQLALLRELQPALDAATQAANENAKVVSQSSPAYADLAQSFAQGTISVDTLTTSLAQFGFVGTGAADQAKVISDALASVLKAEDALPTVGSVMDDFASTVKKDFGQVSDDVSKGTGDVQADLAKLANDSDPQRFADNLNAQTANILKFTGNLRELVAEGFGGLAESLAAKGPEVAGALAQSLADAPAKAAVAAKAEELAGASRTAFDTFLKAHFPELAQLGEQQGSTLAGGVLQGLAASQGPLGSASEELGRGLAEHFHPEFAGRVSAAVNAAASALSADQTIGQAAGQKGLDALAAYQEQFGPVGLAQAVKIALAGAHDAIQKDPTLATATTQKGKEAADNFKPDIAGAVEKQFGLGAGTIQKLTSIALAAGKSGFAVGVAFDAGLAQGINDPGSIGGVTSAATSVATAAELAAKAALKIKSPSLVARSIGQDFTKGLSLGLVDAIATTDQSATQVADALVASLQKKLADGIAKVAAQNDVADALSKFVSQATSALPTPSASLNDFLSGITQARSAESSALDEYHKAYKAYRDDQASLHALQASDSTFQRRIAAANADVADAQSKLSAANAKGDASAISSAQRAFDAAETRLQSLTDRLSKVKSQIGEDQTAIASAAKGLDSAQKSLASASDPAAFIRNLNAQTAASRRFVADIAELQKEGFTDLAKQLADAGPDAAGKLADAFAASPAKAKSAEAAIDHANLFADSYTAQLEKIFGGGTAAKVAATAGTAVGSAFSGSLQSALNATPQQILPLVKAIPPVASTGPLVISNPAVSSFAGGTQTLALDLTVVLEDGSTVRAQTTIPVPPPGASLVQQTKAQVKAL